MKVSVKVAGLRQVGASFDQLSKATARNVGRRALMEAGQITADRASALAPDDPASGPPDLHREITVGTKLTPRQKRLAKKNPELSFAEAFVGVTDKVNAYAHVIEFGSVDTAPQPFMRPAWSETQDGVLTKVSVALGKEIDKAAKRAARKARK